MTQENRKMSRSRTSEASIRNAPLALWGRALGCFRSSPQGQVLVLATIAMFVFIGSVALAADVGFLWTDRRHMQTAADAAAIAAARALRNSQSVTSAADSVAGLDGFTNGTNGAVVTVNNPPSSGLYAGNSNYVEVIIKQPAPTYFMRLFGYSSVNVAARSVGGSINGPACIYALDPSASGAVSLTGNISINASCGLVDDSSSSTALSATGNGTIKTTGTGVAGNYSASGNMTFTPTPNIHVAPVSDPLANVSAPAVGTCTWAPATGVGTPISGIHATYNLTPVVWSGGINISGIITTLNFAAGIYGNGISFTGTVTTANFNPGQYQDSGGSGNSITLQGNAAANFATGSYTFCGPVSIIGNNTTTLQPGLYVGGISITGNANVTFSPGTYVLAGGGLSITGNSTIAGAGVTFYNTSSSSFAYKPINITGNETGSLSAPTSGPLAGILFFQDRSVANTPANASEVVGNSSTTFDGALYFPTTGLTWLGNSSASGYLIVVADTVTVTGNSTMTLGANYAALANGSPIKSSALYE